MTTNYLSPVFNEQTFNASGDPAVSWQVGTYVAGTSTALATYTTQSGTTQQANPIILNARGEPTNPIWLGAGQVYKFVLKDDAGAVIRTIDNVGGINDTSLSVSEWNSSGYTPTYISAISFSVVSDKTTDFATGRRIRSTNSGGTIYSTIESSSYSSGTGLTTVTVRNDSGTLDAGLSTIDIGILMPTNSSVPNSQTFRQTMGLGYGDNIASAATVDFTARTGKIVRVTGTTQITTATMSNGDDFYVIADGALPLNIAGVISYNCTAGDVLHFVQDGSGAQHISIESSSAIVQIQQISASVAANALTISASALSLNFRSTTLGSGAVTRVSGTPSNLVISSGSTLGTVNAVQSDIAILAINNAGTIELAAVNMAGGVDLSETGLISTTAEGGAGDADSATTIYSTTARTSVAYRVIGIVRSTQATAGTWATSPSLIQGSGGEAFTVMSSIGYGQRWQSVTRVTGTTYYTTKPRKIRVVGNTTSGAAGQVTITFSNGTIFSLDYASGTTTNAYAGETTIPANESYTIGEVNIRNRSTYEMF